MRQFIVSEDRKTAKAKATMEKPNFFPSVAWADEQQHEWDAWHNHLAYLPVLHLSPELQSIVTGGQEIDEKDLRLEYQIRGNILREWMPISEKYYNESSHTYRRILAFPATNKEGGEETERHHELNCVNCGSALSVCDCGNWEADYTKNMWGRNIPGGCTLGFYCNYPKCQCKHLAPSRPDAGALAKETKVMAVEWVLKENNMKVGDILGNPEIRQVRAFLAGFSSSTGREVEFAEWLLSSGYTSWQSVTGIKWANGQNNAATTSQLYTLFLSLTK